MSIKDILIGATRDIDPFQNLTRLDGGVLVGLAMTPHSHPEMGLFARDDGLYESALLGACSSTEVKLRLSPFPELPSGISFV
jgi:hypothetical protein